MTSTIIRLPDDLHAQAQALARTTGRTLEEVLTDAVAQGLAYDHRFVAAAEEGRRSTQTGNVASPAEVEDMWNRLSTPEDLTAAESDP